MSITILIGFSVIFTIIMARGERTEASPRQLDAGFVAGMLALIGLAASTDPMLSGFGVVIGTAVVAVLATVGWADTIGQRTAAVTGTLAVVLVVGFPHPLLWVLAWELASLQTLGRYRDRRSDVQQSARIWQHLLSGLSFAVGLLLLCQREVIVESSMFLALVESLRIPDPLGRFSVLAWGLTIVGLLIRLGATPLHAGGVIDDDREPLDSRMAAMIYPRIVGVLILTRLIHGESPLNQPSVQGYLLLFAILSLLWGTVGLLRKGENDRIPSIVSTGTGAVLLALAVFSWEIETPDRSLMAIGFPSAAVLAVATLFGDLLAYLCRVRCPSRMHLSDDETETASATGPLDWWIGFALASVPLTWGFWTRIWLVFGSGAVLLENVMGEPAPSLLFLIAGLTIPIAMFALGVRSAVDPPSRSDMPSVPRSNRSAEVCVWIALGITVLIGVMPGLLAVVFADGLFAGTP